MGGPAGTIPLEDLDEATLAKLGITLPKRKATSPRVSPRLAVMGDVLMSLKGMTVRDALWVLAQAKYHIERQRDTERGVAARRKRRNGDS